MCTNLLCVQSTKGWNVEMAFQCRNGIRAPNECNVQPWCSDQWCRDAVIWEKQWCFSVCSKQEANVEIAVELLSNVEIACALYFSARTWHSSDSGNKKRITRQLYLQRIIYLHFMSIVIILRARYRSVDYMSSVWSIVHSIFCISQMSLQQSQTEWWPSPRLTTSLVSPVMHAILQNAKSMWHSSSLA